MFVPVGWLAAQTSPSEASGANPPFAGNAPAAPPGERIASDLGVWFYRAGSPRLKVADLALPGELARAGLEIDDQVVAVNDRAVNSETGFVVELETAAVANKPATIDVVRGGRRVRITVAEPALKLAVFAPDPLYRAGLMVDTRQPRQLIVSHVFPGSSAYAAGLMAGDLITAIGNSPVVNLGVLRTAVDQVGNDNVLLQVTRGGRSRLFTLNGIEPPIARVASRPERLPAPGDTRGPAAGGTIRQ
jgi:S1-C subfamily serine protease